jgi:uncharacterized repeat protein (TIGR03847 family)
MSEPLEFDPTEFITVGTIGPPGKRVFYLQAGRQRDFVTLVIEKEHAASLAAGIVQVLGEIDEKLDRKTPPPDLEEHDMALREPIKPLFRVAQMGLGYDHERDQMVLVAQELVLASEDDMEAGEIEPRVVRFYASRAEPARRDHRSIRAAHLRQLWPPHRPRRSLLSKKQRAWS